MLKKDSYRILCNVCISSLSKNERQKLYEQRREDKTQEDRICLHCGETFIIKNPKKDASRRKLFCDQCNKILTPYQKKKIKMEKDHSYREHILQGKRESHKRNIVHGMWKRAKDRALKYGYDFNL
jgi:RNase P subunit RPR2